MTIQDFKQYCRKKVKVNRFEKEYIWVGYNFRVMKDGTKLISAILQDDFGREMIVKIDDLESVNSE